MSPSRAIILATLLLPILPSPGRAHIVGHFQVQSVDNVCNVDDSEPITAGDPDLRYRMGIFDHGALGCASGCTGDGNPSTLDGTTIDRCGFTTTCGTWNFSDQTVEKVMQNASAASFYFGLFDDDTDPDDLMGDVYLIANETVTNAVVWNNNAWINANPAMPTSVCGEAVEGGGWANNFRLSYSLWFTDTDGPPPLATPVAHDGGLSGVTTDNDLRFDFTWTSVNDPHTGTSFRASLFDLTAGTPVVEDTPVGFSPTSFCPGGCTLPFTPIDGHAYRFTVSATNGIHPEITNPQTVTSPPVDVLSAQTTVDVPPLAHPLALAAPAPNPTRAGASFAYTVPAAGSARLEVVDLQGRRVTTLADGTAAAGPHRAEWNGCDASGRRVESGVYWVRLAFAGERRLQRLVVVR